MFNSHDRGTVNMKWIHGFPSGYVLDNVLKMDASEVSFWLNEYKEFTMKKVVHQTYTSAWTQDRNLISNANECYQLEEVDSLDTEFAEDKPQPLTSYFKGE